VQNVKVPFSSNAQNATGTSVTLSGTGLQLATPTVTFVQSSPTGSPSYGTTVTFTATVAGSAAASNATPTGSVALVVDGSLQPSVTLSAAGTATLSISGLNGGNHTISVEYNGDTNYASLGSANAVITVVPAGSATTLSITTTAINPVSTTAGSAIVFSSTLTPSIAGAFTGTVSYVSGTTVLATAPVIGGPGGTFTASANVTTVPVGSYIVVSVYSGNADYNGSTSSPAIPLIVLAGPTGGPTFTVTPSPAAITSSVNSFGSTTLTVTSLAGFQGAVDFSCSGLPAHATCIFNPAILTLLANNSGTPVSVGGAEHHAHDRSRPGPAGYADCDLLVDRCAPVRLSRPPPQEPGMGQVVTGRGDVLSARGDGDRALGLRRHQLHDARWNLHGDGDGDCHARSALGVPHIERWNGDGQLPDYAHGEVAMRRRR